jgi:glyceraldehyde 3-phosphate dehydrogenase
MPNKVAINGLGRIGRAALKLAVEQPELDVVAVNEIGSLENMVYLLKYDTVYGRYERQVEAVDGKLVIDGKPLVYLSERDPERLPWADLEVELVLECTGRFTDREDAEKHVRAGAGWVVLSGPTKSPDVPTIVHGVNRPDGETQIISCASCTTNNITPLVEILDRHFGVDKALPAMEGRFDAVSVRGPVAVGSISDVVFVLERDTTVDEVNDVLRREASTDRYQGVLAVADEPLVSTDIVKDPHASIVQLDLTRVVGGTLVKVMSWYDNEWGFTSQMIQVAVQQLGLDTPTRV